MLACNNCLPATVRRYAASLSIWRLAGPPARWPCTQSNADADIAAAVKRYRQSIFKLDFKVRKMAGGEKAEGTNGERPLPHCASNRLLCCRPTAHCTQSCLAVPTPGHLCPPCRQRSSERALCQQLQVFHAAPGRAGLSPLGGQHQEPLALWTLRAAPAQAAQCGRDCGLR